MGKKPPLSIFITGGGHHIGLAVAWHFLNQEQSVIASYRVHYPITDGLREAGAICIPAGSPTDEGVLAFADEVKAQTDGLRTTVHSASAWPAEKPGTLLTDVLLAMMQIHIGTPYLLNHALEGLLHGYGYAVSDIIHFADCVIECGSNEHITYTISKAVLGNMTRSFSRRLAPEVKVSAIAPSLTLLSEGDDTEYRQQVLDKSLTKAAPGEKEIIDLTDYLLTSCFATGRSFVLDGRRHLH